MSPRRLTPCCVQQDGGIDDHLSLPGAVKKIERFRHVGGPDSSQRDHVTLDTFPDSGLEVGRRD
jgi:hypothetical protein